MGNQALDHPGIQSTRDGPPRSFHNRVDPVETFQGPLGIALPLVVKSRVHTDVVQPGQIQFAGQADSLVHFVCGDQVGHDLAAGPLRPFTGFSKRSLVGRPKHGNDIRSRIERKARFHGAGIHDLEIRQQLPVGIFPFDLGDDVDPVTDQQGGSELDDVHVDGGLLQQAANRSRLRLVQGELEQHDGRARLEEADFASCPPDLLYSGWSPIQTRSRLGCPGISFVPAP